MRLEGTKRVPVVCFQKKGIHQENIRAVNFYCRATQKKDSGKEDWRRQGGTKPIEGVARKNKRGKGKWSVGRVRKSVVGSKRWWGSVCTREKPDWAKEKKGEVFVLVY